MVLNGTVEVDGCYVGGYVRPANFKAQCIDRQLAENQNGKRKCVVVMRAFFRMHYLTAIDPLFLKSLRSAFRSGTAFPHRDCVSEHASSLQAGWVCDDVGEGVQASWHLGAHALAWASEACNVSTG